ncbi:DUF3883 domain-containing protein [Paenibacillus sp. GbtcB18]|uniref:DUF3883 domain-containing protein n=1 Tax=Paenibacillus sp. GbtcB18 TaxID=2824763 RepID=UPI001C30E5A9|nr:DUF3883 domain-containing protein [Paenibacillus sp. GbtcB18]
MELQLMRTYALLNRMNEMTNNKLIDEETLQEQFENVNEFENDFLDFNVQLNRIKDLNLSNIDQVVEYMVLLHLKFDKLKWYLDEMHEIVRHSAGNYRELLQGKNQLEIQTQEVVRHYSTKSEERQKIGYDFELFVLEYEKQALISAGKDDLALMVKHVDEGYDILSFEENGKPKFIECKIISNNNLKGIKVSKNQMNMAKRYGDQYYFYIQDKDKNLTIIRNPYQAIINSGDIAVPIMYDISFPNL